MHILSTIFCYIYLLEIMKIIWNEKLTGTCMGVASSSFCCASITLLSSERCFLFHGSGSALPSTTTILAAVTPFAKVIPFAIDCQNIDLDNADNLLFYKNLLFFVPITRFIWQRCFQYLDKHSLHNSFLLWALRYNSFLHWLQVAGCT